MSQEPLGGPPGDEDAPPTVVNPGRPQSVPPPAASGVTPSTPPETRKPTLPPVPASVPRPTTARSQRPETARSHPPPPAGASPLPPAGEVAAPILSTGAVPPAPRTPHIDAYDSEVTTEYDPFGDDAPTADYDPRQRGIFASPGVPPSPAAPPRAPGSGPPPVPSIGSDRPTSGASAPPRPGASGGPPSSPRRRSSRRTVRIPNDVHERAGLRPLSSPPLPPPEGQQSYGEGEIIKPMPILNIGSQPPARLPTPMRPRPAVPSAPSAHEDLEHGWTPMPAAVSDAQETLPVMPAVTDAMLAEAGMVPPGEGARLQAPAAHVEIDALEDSTGADSEPELELIETEPPRAAAPPVPPPKPPARPQTPAVAASPAVAAPAAPAVAPAATPPAAAARAEEPALKKPKAWWEDLFGDDYIRTLDRLPAKHVVRETTFIEESLGLERGAVILDLACGEGQHAVELASRGYSVVGFDLSLPMLSRAADEAQERGQKINFLHGDMREMAFEEMFDGIYCWSTSFGYFDDDRNLSVLQRIHRALRQGGNFLLDVINRDYVASRAPSLVWFEGEGCTCMDDMHVDFFTSRLRVKRTAMFDDGHSRELDYSIRLYTLHELGKMLHEVGFKVVEVTGHPAHPGVFFGAESPRMIILAERA